MTKIVMQGADEADLFESAEERSKVQAELEASAELPAVDTAMIDRALGGVAAADSQTAEPGAPGTLAPSAEAAPPGSPPASITVPSTTPVQGDPTRTDHATGALASAFGRGGRRPAATPAATPDPAPAAVHVVHTIAPAMATPPADGAAEEADDAADAQQIADAVLAALAPRLAALEQQVAALDTPAPRQQPPAQIVAVESAKPRVGAITFQRDAAGNLTGITLPPTSE